MAYIRVYTESFDDPEPWYQELPKESNIFCIQTTDYSWQEHPVKKETND